MDGAGVEMRVNVCPPSERSTEEWRLTAAPSGTHSRLGPT